MGTFYWNEKALFPTSYQIGGKGPQMQTPMHGQFQWGKMHFCGSTAEQWGNGCSPLEKENNILSKGLQHNTGQQGNNLLRKINQLNFFLSNKGQNIPVIYPLWKNFRSNLVLPNSLTASMAGNIKYNPSHLPTYVSWGMYKLCFFVGFFFCSLVEDSQEHMFG